MRSPVVIHSTSRSFRNNMHLKNDQSVNPQANLFPVRVLQSWIIHIFSLFK